MLSCYFRALRLGGVLTSPKAQQPSGLQMTPPSLPGTENPGKHGSPDFILILLSALDVTWIRTDARSVLPPNALLRVWDVGVLWKINKFKQLCFWDCHSRTWLTFWIVFLEFVLQNTTQDFVWFYSCVCGLGDLLWKTLKFYGIWCMTNVKEVWWVRILFLNFIRFCKASVSLYLIYSCQLSRINY